MMAIAKSSPVFRPGIDAAASVKPASWPNGVSLLAQAVDACGRGDSGEECGEWLARAPRPIVLPAVVRAETDAFKPKKR